MARAAIHLHAGLVLWRRVCGEPRDNGIAAVGPANTTRSLLSPPKLHFEHSRYTVRVCVVERDQARWRAVARELRAQFGRSIRPVPEPVRIAAGIGLDSTNYRLFGRGSASEKIAGAVDVLDSGP